MTNKERSGWFDYMEDDEEVEQEEVGQRHAIPVDLLWGP